MAATTVEEDLDETLDGAGLLGLLEGLSDLSGERMVDRFVAVAEEVMKGILALYDQDKLTQAFPVLAELKRLLLSSLGAIEEREEGGESALVPALMGIKRLMEAEPRFGSLESEIVEVEQVLGLMEGDDGWTLVKESERMKTWYRHVDGNPVHSIKIDALLNVPLFNLLSIINEVDLYVDWIPFLKESRETITLSKYRRGAYMHFGLPWPLSDRDASIYAYGVDQLQDKNQLTIVCRSVGEGFGGDGEGQTGGIYAQRLVAAAPAVTSSRVRVDLRMSGGLLRPVSPTQTQLIVMANADPQMAVIPYWLLNFVTKQLGGMLVGRLEVLAQGIDADPESKFTKRIAEKPHIYADIMMRVSRVVHPLPESASNPDLQPQLNL